MEDGGWSAHARAAAAAAKKKTAAAGKKGAAAARKKKEKNAASTWREKPLHAVPFAELPGVADAVREGLEELGATEPSFMIGKILQMSDVDREQARLLFSCKREAPAQVTAVFTGAEMQFVEDKTVKTGGLLVPAFDRAGRRYDLVCKYLDSNEGYRFITGWKAYALELENGLGVGTLVELWTFRSRKLHNRYVLRLGENGKDKKVPVMVDIGHPDGSLGLVLLQYHGNDLPEPEQQAAVDGAPPAQETETTGTGHMESKTTTTIAKEKLADDVSREEVFKAAIGLLKLREYFCGGGGARRRRDGGAGGQGQGEPES